MRSALGLLAGVFVLISGLCRAEVATICDQRAEYSPHSPVEAVAPELRAMFGQWRGSVAFSGILEMCFGLVFEQVQPNGSVVVKYIWSTAAGVGFNNTNKSGVGNPWKGRIDNGVLKLVGKEIRIELKMVKPNELAGTYTDRNGSVYPAWLKRL